MLAQLRWKIFYCLSLLYRWKFPAFTILLYDRHTSFLRFVRNCHRFLLCLSLFSIVFYKRRMLFVNLQNIKWITLIFCLSLSYTLSDSGASYNLHLQMKPDCSSMYPVACSILLLPSHPLKLPIQLIILSPL